MAQIRPLKLAVIGSRAWSDDQRVYKTLDHNKGLISHIVSGRAVSGPDRFGERWAHRSDIPTIIYPPDHTRKHAYHYRNRLIAEEADIGLAFQVNGSSGTQYTIDYMRKIGKPCFIRRISQRPRDCDLTDLITRWCADHHIDLHTFC